MEETTKDIGGNNEYYSGHGLSYRPHPLSPPPAAREEPDYLGSLDWSQGSIADNARSVVENLLRKDLSSTRPYNYDHTGASNQSHDPRVAMEMRHKKVGML